ncbi:DUF2786 domain-containing protein [Parabacteroides merdae]|mgnify:FL=1|uniref:DUF7168 domain-containing protein n=3 Tax=Bacteroidia TaxID=200643 RepID=A0AA37KG21_9BACT|nr:DUF2786 domain-containing protein [Parabacteroides merdae]MDB8918759.1 DUF2786 domain-containing protein [Parabacteroides merdae]GKH73467.1 hypothetical protein CE91St3_33300 [Parabacteroides merdae]
MDTDKILQKLRKLMNLKESAAAVGNVGEANAAAAGITRLLLEYNLSEKDIPEQDKIDNPIAVEDIPYRTSVENGVWYRELVQTVCYFNFCKLLICLKMNSKTGKRERDKFKIVGRKNNVETVLYLISFLSNKFVVLGRKEYPAYHRKCILELGKSPLSQKAFLRSFLIGCIVGIREKFERDQKEFGESITALIVSNNDMIDEFLKKEMGDIKNARKSKKPDIDMISGKQGFIAGYNVEINKGIYSKDGEHKTLTDK